MKKNVGKLDIAIRIILGIAVVGIGIYFQSWWGLIGLVPLITAIIGSCPAYALIGITTKKRINVEKLKKI